MKKRKTSNASCAPGHTGSKQLLKTLRTQANQFRISEDWFLELAKMMWVGLDTPRALTCHMLLEAGEYAQLVNLRCDPLHYCDRCFGSSLDGRAFADDYQATELLAKWPNFVHKDLDPVGACLLADDAAENACRASNRRLRRARAHPEVGETAYLHLISRMQADIAYVLGGFDPTRWEESCRFGPGKSMDQHGLLDYEKLVARPSCTADFLPFGVQLISGCPRWLDALGGHAPDPFSGECQELEDGVWSFEVCVSPGDKNTMVPKNAKTHRGIRPQPGLNVYAQLGLGSMIRERLREFGLDLDDQAPNQRLAKLGSDPRSTLVTIDLKGASGHICKELVSMLLEDSPRWLHAMNLCRTYDYLPHKESGSTDWRVLQSYSAMGNGFTFELETLIFWAAIRAVRRAIKDTQQYRVYGDDIICSRQVAVVLIPFLEFLGFPTNVSKTYLTGPFRESCGADYWLGTNVRPIHFSISTEEIEDANKNGTSILRWLQTCNAIRRLARRRNHGFGCDRRLLACWRTAILHIPRTLRDSIKTCWIEDEDTSLITHYEDAVSNPLIRRCGSLQALVSPRLYVHLGKEKPPRSFFGGLATLLYRSTRKDRIVCRFDRNRSWLQRVIQHSPVLTDMQKRVAQITGLDPYAEARKRAVGTSVLPDMRSIGLGAGWEVFQPVADITEWL